MHKLSHFFKAPLRDAPFAQTEFADTTQKNSFCFVVSPKYLKAANENPSITCIITTKELAEQTSPQKGLVISANPEQDFYMTHNKLVREHNMRPTFTAAIAPTAKIHETATIDPHVLIGANVEIGPGAVIQGGTILDDDVVIGPNAIIGANGHFNKRHNGHLVSVLHAGGVHLKKKAQVLAGAIVSKALHTNFTHIGEESVISINAHIAHGCKIGDRCIIAGSSQIAGYSTLGNDVWVGPSSSIGNLRKIGNNVSIEIGSVVIDDIPDNAQVSGHYAIDHKKNMMQFVRKRGAIRK